MTAGIYVGAPTAWQHARTIENRAAVEQESREKRVATRQASRVRTIAVLTLMSLVEWGVVCMSYYVNVPTWLIVVNVVCVFFNVPLIWWLGGLWWDQRKREKEIERQYKKYRR